MPETAIHENSDLGSCENNVGNTSAVPEGALVDAIPEAARMES
ncbi:hypothetical protein PR371_03090 [Mycobacterium marinum]|nr:hypothetical protein [Mycobacterium marinum]MDC8992962.1 hypothetical protein [Mycobacterium marinum]MDC9015046.1 hypothetical protein [Mycobacterium marinum]WDZ12817.1 hypothetical protein PQR73_019485 [Mycobacterium marinum]